MTDDDQTSQVEQMAKRVTYLSERVQLWQQHWNEVLAGTAPLSLNGALKPLLLTQEEADELDDLLAHPRAFPTVPIVGVPRGSRDRLHRADVTDK